MDEFTKDNLIKLAASVKEMLKAEYDLDGVQALYDSIEKLRPMAFTLNDETKQTLVSGWGAFLGQAIIETYGGQWAYDEENGYSIMFDEKNKAYPITKVGKQFDNGPEDSVVSFFQTIPIVFKEIKKL